MSSRDLQPQKWTTEVPPRLDQEAMERYAEWRDACVAVDEAYCAWSHASACERPGAFAAYRAALDQEESIATIYEQSLGEQSLTGDQRLRVLIADQDGFARRMLQRVLQDVDAVAVATGARDGPEALELTRRQRPGMLLVDIAVPPAGGVELIRRVMPILPRVRIVTLSATTDRDQAVLAALHAGAIGHIDKDTAPDQIARLLTLAAGGEAIVPRRLMTRLLASAQHLRRA